MEKTESCKSGQYSKWIVSVIIFLNSIFSLGVLYVFMKTSVEPVVLIGAWYTWTTGELWMLASVKKHKIKHQPKECEE